MKVVVRELGLAAYLKANGCKVIGYENREFVFESDKEKKEWEIEYLNSCCSKHDGAVMELRKLITKL